MIRSMSATVKPCKARLPTAVLTTVSAFPVSRSARSFPDADDRRQPCPECGNGFSINSKIRLAVKLPPLRMSDYNVRAADVPDHIRRHLARVRADFDLAAQSCAAMRIFDPSTRSATVFSAVKTGAITTSQWVALATSGLSAAPFRPLFRVTCTSSSFRR